MSILSIHRGNDATGTITVKAADGGPFNLDGSILTFTAKRIIPNTVTNVMTKTTGNGIVHTDESAGIATVTFTDAETAAFTKPTALAWKLVLTDAGENDYTVAKGTLEIL